MPPPWVVVVYFFNFVLFYKSSKSVKLFVYSPLERLKHSQCHKMYGRH